MSQKKITSVTETQADSSREVSIVVEGIIKKDSASNHHPQFQSMMLRQREIRYNFLYYHACLP